MDLHAHILDLLHLLLILLLQGMLRMHAPLDMLQLARPNDSRIRSRPALPSHRCQSDTCTRFAAHDCPAVGLILRLLQGTR